MSIQAAIPLLEWDVADRMRKALRSSGTGVAEMADYLGVSRNTVGTWINGRITPSTQTLRLWALRTGAPYEWLANGEAPHPDGPDGGLEACAIRDSNPEPAGLEYLRPDLRLLGSVGRSYPLSA